MNICIVRSKLSTSIVLPLLLKDGVLVLILIGRFLKFLKARKEISGALSFKNYVENHF